MEGTEQRTLGVDDLPERLRQAIAERRHSGAPIDEWADGHPALRAGPGDAAAALAELRRELEALRDRSVLDPAKITTASNLPGGTTLHRAVGRVVARQTEGTMQQVHTFTEQTIVTLEAVVEILDRYLARSHEDLGHQIDEVLIRLARLERGMARPGGEAAYLRPRVEELEAAEANRRFQPTYRNEDFEARFRGSREDLLERYADIADRLVGCDPVLDVGFGRGEILELLAARGVAAQGVEVDPALVAAARERGFDASTGDGLATLAGFEDAALGGVVLIQVVEHLPAQRLLELVALAFDKLRPGGRLVMETVNPQSLSVFAHSFYLDPTHERPVHPAYLEFLCRQVGFAAVELDWRSWPAESDRLAPVNGTPAVAANIAKLNQLLFGPQDYAVIATR